MRLELLEKIRLSKKNIDLGHMAILDEDINDISNAIVKSHPLCKEIFLNNNLIKDQGALIIAKRFIALKHLTYLDLQHNQISEEGLKSLMSLQKNSPRLTIGLHGNLIRIVPEEGDAPTDDDYFSGLRQ